MHTRAHENAMPGFWYNLNLIPLFSLIFGGILFLFVCSSTISAWFLTQGQHSLDVSTDEISVRQGLLDSSTHMRSARLNIIQAGAAARIADTDNYAAFLSATEGSIKKAENGLNIYLNRPVRTPVGIELDKQLQARFKDYLQKG